MEQNQNLTHPSCDENTSVPTSCSIFNNANFSSHHMLLKQMTCFLYAKSTMPENIPMAFHTMSVQEMKKETNGNYWCYAANFLVNNKANGITFWKNLERQIQSMEHAIICKPHSSSNTKVHEEQLLMSTDIYCDHFLTEPIVLVQLPFQPVLLHMWLTHVYFALLKIEFHMSWVYTIPIPAESWKLVKKLDNILRSTQRNVGFLFDYLHRQTKGDGDIFVGNLKCFYTILSEVIAPLDFICNGYGPLVASSLACHCLNNLKSTSKTYKLTKERMPLKDRNFMYNPRFWRQSGRGLKIFGSSNEIIVREPDFYVKIKAAIDFEDADLVDIQKFAREQLRDDFYNIDIDKIKNNRDVLDCFRDFNDQAALVKILMDDANGYEPIIDIISWQADIDFRCSFFKLVQTINRVMKKSPCDSFRFDIINVMSKSEIRERLRKQEEINWDDLLQTIRNGIGALHLECPNVSDAPDSIALKFETRIKKVVIDSIASQYQIKNFEEEKDEKLRDWHMVQYFLPCFVVSFLDFCESTNPNESAKEWYVKFIHNLISTFESEGIRKSSKLNIMIDMEKTTALRDSCSDNGTNELRDYLNKIARQFANKIMGDHSAMKNLVKVGFFKAFYEALEKRDQRPNIECIIPETPSLYWNWLLWDFFRRMELAMERIS